MRTLKIVIHIIFIYCFASSCFAVDKAELIAGDLIFWKEIQKVDRAGHVAVLNNDSNKEQELRIIHSTNNPKYEAFVETPMLSSAKLQQHEKEYFVIRIIDPQIRAKFIKILRILLDQYIPFNDQTEAIMKQWDDSMGAYSTALKFKLQNELFADKPVVAKDIPDEGYMCSEIIIITLQKAFLQNNNGPHELPISLQLDPVLCPPSTLMFALEHDKKNFQILGELTYTP